MVGDSGLRPASQRTLLAGAHGCRHAAQGPRLLPGGLQHVARRASVALQRGGVAVGSAGLLLAATVRPGQSKRRHLAGRAPVRVAQRAAAEAEPPEDAEGLITEDIVKDAERCLSNNYGKRDLVMVRGEGHYLFDSEGKQYLDFTGGIAVNCLGHSDLGWAEVVSMQAQTLTHTSNYYLNVHQVELARKLTDLSFADKVFFCNTGTEANEAAIKYSRKFHADAGKPRERFIAFEGGFHGRTMGALSLTWKEAFKAPFEPLMPSVDFLKFNSTADLNSVDETTCAVFVEPMQGEGGVVPASTEFLTALRKRCDEVGALLVFDEVQCGLGRSGHLFNYEISGVTPDIMTLAKPLAGGLPIGAVLMVDKVAAIIAPGNHGSTFAGAPLVCAAACYTLGRVSEEPFLDNVRQMGERLSAGLQRLAEPHGLTVRGQGLLLAVVFEDAKACSAVVSACRDTGLLVLTAGAGNVLRLAPALTVGEAEVDVALVCLEKAFQEALAPVPA